MAVQREGKAKCMWLPIPSIAMNRAPSSLKDWFTGNFLLQANVNTSLVGGRFSKLRQSQLVHRNMARFHMRENRRVGRVIYSFYISASSSVKWTLCGNIWEHQQRLLESSSRELYFLFPSLLWQKDSKISPDWLSITWWEDRVSLKFEGACRHCGKRAWQLGQYPHKDTISNLSNCFSLETPIILTYYLIWLSLSEIFFLQL